MPELPEVETMRRGIAPIVGSRIRDVQRPKSTLHPIKITPGPAAFRRRALGKRIVSVGRVGKRVVVELDSGDRIVFEPRMTGRLLLTEPPDRKHLRLVLHLSGGRLQRLFFWNLRGLGVVRLMSPEQCACELGPKKLGPDALEVSAEELRARLETSRRAIKVALMDQRAVAGIGNLYASEILHRARLHPELACDQLRPADWKRLVASIREVLEEAIAMEGSTLSDGTYRNARNRPGGHQRRHRVYQRAGLMCVQCNRSRIVRTVQAQRSSFFCPQCQRRRRQGVKRAKAVRTPR